MAWGMAFARIGGGFAGTTRTSYGFRRTTNLPLRLYGIALTMFPQHCQQLTGFHHRHLRWRWVALRDEWWCSGWQLLEGGANANAKKDGLTPLHGASWNGRDGVVQRLDDGVKYGDEL